MWSDNTTHYDSSTHEQCLTINNLSLGTESNILLCIMCRIARVHILNCITIATEPCVLKKCLQQSIHVLSSCSGVVDIRREEKSTIYQSSKRIVHVCCCACRRAWYVPHGVLGLVL